MLRRRDAYQSAFPRLRAAFYSQRATGRGPSDPVWKTMHRRLNEQTYQTLSRAAYKPLDLIETSAVEGALPFTAPTCKEVTTTVMVFRVFVESVEMLHSRV
jgi:hypothetical protein